MPRKFEVRFSTNAPRVAGLIDKTNRNLMRQVKKTTEDMANQVRGFYEMTTLTWTKRPRFYRKVRREQEGGYAFDVGTYNKRYHGIDEGTGVYGPRQASYIIRPRRGNKRRILAWQSTYVRATDPKSKNASVTTLMARPASRSGPWRVARSVLARGIEPRNFTKRIQRWVRLNAGRILERDINRRIAIEGWQR